MANIKITELNAAGSLAATDVVPVVDVSADETKKITATDLFRTLPDGTAAAPALAFSSDAANGVYLAGTDTVGISTGGTQRVTVDGSGNVSISGDLTVSGATTTVESTTVTIDDKNIELGSVASPSNTTADGGGITLKGATDKTLKWIDSTGCWTFNQPMNFNDHVRIDSSGSVGIGESSNIDSRLHVKEGTVSGKTTVLTLEAAGTTADDGPAIDFIPNGSSLVSGSIVGARPDASGADGYLGFYTNNGTSNSERLRIDSSGRVGIGTSSPQSELTVRGSTPQITLEPTADTQNCRLQFATTNGTVQSFLGGGGSDGAAIKFFQTTTERVRIDSSGRLLVGTSSSVSAGSGAAAMLQVEHGGGNVTGAFYCTANTAQGGTLVLGHGRGSATGVLQDGDTLGDIRFAGADGTDLQTQGAFIRASVDGTPGSNDMPGRLVFSTTADGSSSPTERMRISSTGLHTITASNNSTAVQIRDASNYAGQLVTATDGTFQINARTTTTFTRTGSNTESMRINSGGKVGIGTSSIDERLHVEGSGTNERIKIENTTSNIAGLVMLNTSRRYDVQVNGSDLQVYDNTGSAERLRIDSSGNVGIGTSSPTVELDVTGDARLRSTSTSDGPILQFDGAGPNGTNYTFGKIEADNTGSNNAGELRFYTNLASAGGLAQRMVIARDGSVGIGTSSPDQTLSVQGLISTKQSNGATRGLIGSPSWDGSKIAIQNGTLAQSYTNVALHQDVTGNTVVNSATGGATQFAIGGGERARIDSSGRLLVGTSTRINSNGEALIQAASTSNDRLITAYNFENDASGPFISLGKSRGTSVGSFTILQDNDELGNIAFFAADGTDLNTEGARIQAEVDGTPGTNDMPTRLVFATTADGANSPTERLRITSTGAFAIEGASNYGTSGQVLTSNGNDAPSWQDASGGSTDSISEGNTSVECVDTGSDGHITFDTEGSEQMRIDGSGRLLVRTTTEGDVNADNLTLADAANCGITIRSGTGNQGALFFSDATSGTGEYDGFITYDQGTRAMRLGTATSERMRILSSGGLTFNGDTAQANALDDYEEGTFTPTINSGFTASYNSQAGRYTKVGNVVHFFISIDLSSLSGSSSDVYAEVEGLPFTATSTGNIDNAVTVAWQYQLGNNVYHAYIEQGGTHIVLLGEPSGGSRTHWNPGQVWDDNDSRIALSGTYTTTA